MEPLGQSAITIAQQNELKKLCQRLAFLTGTSLPPRLERLDEIFRSMAVSIEVCGKRISRGRESRNRLREIQEELERLERDKSQIVRRISHELRAPLASIDGFAKALLAESETIAQPLDGSYGSQRQHEFLKIIAREATRLADVIESLIELSTIEAGLTGEQTTFTAGDVCNAALRGVSREPCASRVVVKLFPEPQGPTLRADKAAIVEALRQLICNAQKFSAGQDVLLGAEYVMISGIGAARSSTDGSGVHSPAVRFMVRDKGVGIPPEESQRIFDKFYRSALTAPGFAGAGLGLSIVRALVNRNSGHVWAESEVGHGSTFFILLPTA